MDEGRTRGRGRGGRTDERYGNLAGGRRAEGGGGGWGGRSRGGRTDERYGNLAGWRRAEGGGSVWCEGVIDRGKAELREEGETGRRRGLASITYHVTTQHQCSLYFYFAVRALACRVSSNIRDLCLLHASRKMLCALVEKSCARARAQLRGNMCSTCHFQILIYRSV